MESLDDLDKTIFVPWDTPSFRGLTIGEWIRENDRPQSWKFICSDCGKISFYPATKIAPFCPYKYCPWCGKEKRLDKY